MGINPAISTTSPTAPSATDATNASQLNQILGKLVDTQGSQGADVVAAVNAITAAVVASLIGGTTGVTANHALVSKGTGGFALQATPATIDPASGDVTTAGFVAAGTMTIGGVPVYPNLPQNSQSAAYVLVLADAQKQVLHPSSDNNPRVFTIPANASVAYPVGTSITFVNQINTVTIAITSDTLTFAGVGSTGSRTLAASGIATALKLASTSWIISGVGLT